MLKSVKYGVCAVLLVAGNGVALAELPEMNAEYVGEARYEWEGKEVDATIRGKGKLMRIDIAAAEIGMPTGVSVIMDFENSKFVSFSTGAVPENMRFYIEMADSSFHLESTDVAVVGTEKVAGKTCTNYQSFDQTETGEITTFTNCITSDGIWLKATEGVKKVVFEMQSVAKGPQPAALFEPPPGYTQMDMGSFGDLDFGNLGKDGQSDENSKIKQVQDETKQQVEDKVDEERRKKVDKFLGKIFGN